MQKDFRKSTQNLVSAFLCTFAPLREIVFFVFFDGYPLFNPY